MFDNTAVARDGTLQSGDEIVGVGGESVKGLSKVEVAKLIQVFVDFINFIKIYGISRYYKTSLNCELN